MSTPETSPVPEVPQSLTVTALALAPAAIGCAAGILIGQRLRSRSGNAAAGTLLALAAAASLPLVLEATLRIMNRPESRRRIQGIQRGLRDASDHLFADELAGNAEDPSEARNTVSFPGL
ncbi:MAG: hypothetical protein KGS60_09055 [Verrucomicrobia bacterium]|nr:hypothetical protein [Verrucomicrobiota bacterium]